MLKFKDVPLPDYTRVEDTANSVTHALGVPLSIMAIIISIDKLGQGVSPVKTAAVIVYGVCMLILYLGSAYYHGLKPGIVKQVARVLDHANVFLMIAGSLTAFFLLGIFDFDRTQAIILCSISWIVAITGIILTFINQEKFKKVQMAMYLLLGWFAVFGISTVYKSYPFGKELVMLIFLGGVAYTVGAIFYGIGKSKRYAHTVFHLFILAGTALQFVGIYKYLL